MPTPETEISRIVDARLATTGRRATDRHEDRLAAIEAKLDDIVARLDAYQAIAKKFGFFK